MTAVGVNIAKTHENLMKTNTGYRENVEHMAINRREDIVPEVNEEIDSRLRDWNRRVELFMGEVSHLILIPPGEQPLKAIEDTEDDFMFAIFADTGMHLMGNKAGYDFDWTRVKYIIFREAGVVYLEMWDSTTLMFGDDNVPMILRELALEYNREFGQEFVVLEEVWT